MIEVPLTKGYVAVIDDDDADLVLGSRWHVSISSRPYARTDIDGKNIFMHRRIMNPAPGLVVDHIDGDSLNNTRGNLRIATYSQNTANRAQINVRNTSGFTGVVRNGSGWMAQHRHLKSYLYLGTYRTKEEAALAYDEKCRELYGEFAVLNFPLT